MLGSARIAAAGVLLAGPALLPASASAGQSPSAAARSGSAATFTRDVAPILYEHCIVCHHDGGLAPFPLLSYADTRPWARAVRQAVATRSMPPWKPSPGYGGPFHGERRLSDDAIRVIQEWVDGGAPEGDPMDLPPAPALPSGWHLEPPDLVVSMTETYVHEAGRQDNYRNFVAPIPVAAARYVRAFQFRPQSPAVHHARILLDRSGSARRRDREDPTPGYDDRLGDEARFPTGHLMAWAPGKIPAPAPDEIAWRLEPGTDLVMQLHLSPMAGPTPVRAEVGFYFADDPPTRTPAVLVLGNKTIDIPAGDAHHVVEDAYRLPVDVEVLAVYPHAHYLGRDLQAWATRPDGSRDWLIRIEDWDFDWQDEYRYVTPKRLPKGTTLHMRYTYDNSAGNPRNTQRQLARVRYGRRSTDEMAELVLQVLPRTAEDHEVLTSDFARKAIAVDVAGAEKRLRDEPGNYGAHHELGLYHLEAGRLDEAAGRFEGALELNPAFAPAHYNLGVILTARGELESAADRYRQALAHDPDHAESHANLGAVWQLQGRLDDAVGLYRRAIAIAPDLADAHHNLAGALQTLGRTDDAIASYRRVLELTPDDAAAHFHLAATLAARQPAAAVRHFRRAVEVNPDEPAYLNGLAWLLAVHPDDGVRNPHEAARFAEQAARLTGRRHALVLDTLAAALAAAGRYDQAVRTVEEALALLPAGEAVELAGRMRKRLGLYARRLAVSTFEPQ